LKALIVVAWISGALVLIVQGFYIVLSGKTVWFFAGAGHYRRVSRAGRLGYAIVYFFPGVGAILILATLLKEAGVSRFMQWMHQNGAILFAELLLAAGAVMYLVRPAKMIGWTMRDYPELADNRGALITARLIGLVVLILALLMISKL